MCKRRNLCALILGLAGLGISQSTSAAIYYVKAGASGANNGLNWTDAFTDLQSGIAAATANDKIWIAEGLYSPGVNTSDFFLLSDSVSWIGGFAGTPGTEGDINSQDPTAFVTVLTGNFANDFVVRGANIADPSPVGWVGRLTHLFGHFQPRSPAVVGRCG